MNAKEIVFWGVQNGAQWRVAVNMTFVKTPLSYFYRIHPGVIFNINKVFYSVTTQQQYIQ
jgi:hypothetical protein